MSTVEGFGLARRHFTISPRRLSKKFFPTGQRSLECQGIWVLVPRVFRLLPKRDQYKANWTIKASYPSVCSAADCSAECWLLSVNASPYLLNDSLMSQPDLIYGRIKRQTYATSGILASPHRNFKWNLTDHLLIAGTHSNARAINGTHPWSPALWCRCNAFTARAVVFKLSLKNKVSLTFEKITRVLSDTRVPGYRQGI